MYLLKLWQKNFICLTHNSINRGVSIYKFQHLWCACCLSFQGKAVGSWTTLKTKAANSSEMLVSIHQSKLHHIPTHRNFIRTTDGILAQYLNMHQAATVCVPRPLTDKEDRIILMGITNFRKTLRDPQFCFTFLTRVTTEGGQMQPLLKSNGRLHMSIS